MASRLLFAWRMKQTFLFLSAALVACSSGETTEPVDYDQLYGELATAYCDRVFACCVPEERMLVGIIPFAEERPDIPDAAACTAYMTDYLREQGRIATMASSVADGSVAYDGQRAADCLAELAAMSCEAFGHDIGGARDMRACSPFVATLADGAACAWDEQCPSGYCSEQVCAAKPAQGDFCPVGVCADGLFCDSFGDATCKPQLADGADCTFDTDCGSGYCNWDIGTGDTGICSIAAEWVCDGSS